MASHSVTGFEDDVEYWEGCYRYFTQLRDFEGNLFREFYSVGYKSRSFIWDWERGATFIELRVMFTYGSYI